MTGETSRTSQSNRANRANAIIDPDDSRYEYYIPRISRPVKWLIISGVVIIVLVLLWFVAFPAAQDLLPGVY